MRKQIMTTLLAAGFITACGGFNPFIPTPAPTSTATLAPPTILPTLTATYTPTATPTSTPTQTLIPSPTLEVPPLDTAIPVPPGVFELREGFFSSEGVDSLLFMHQTIFLDDLRDFYITELTNRDWTWVYTEEGSSNIPATGARLLILEFKKDGQKLDILAYGPEEGGAFVSAAVGFSGYFQFGALVISSVDSTISSPSPEEIQPASMQFSSPFLSFNHPSHWVAQDRLMQRFYGDDNSTYMLEGETTCSVEFDPCLVAFANLSNSHFDVPVSIRLWSDFAGLTLEEVDALRWQQLNSPSNPYRFPEDVAVPGSLTSLETRNFMLVDGTPALQRIYQWKQLKFSGIMIGTYTLFSTPGGYIEFHTDYRSDEWDFMKPLIEQVNASMSAQP